MINNVWSTEKLTKRSSKTVLHLVSFSAEQSLDMNLSRLFFPLDRPNTSTTSSVPLVPPGLNINTVVGIIAKKYIEIDTEVSTSTFHIKFYSYAQK